MTMKFNVPKLLSSFRKPPLTAEQVGQRVLQRLENGIDVKPGESIGTSDAFDDISTGALKGLAAYGTTFSAATAIGSHIAHRNGHPNVSRAASWLSGASAGATTAVILTIDARKRSFANDIGAQTERFVVYGR